MSQSPRCIALIDIGSARTKLLIARLGEEGDIEFERHKAESGIASDLDSSGALSDEGRAKLRAAVVDLAAIAHQNECQSVYTFATDVIRRATNTAMIINDLEEIAGPIAILDPALEGALFLRAVRKAIPEQSICAIDVGGGSVQIAWGDSEEKVVSIPTGTLRLEKDFQNQGLSLVDECAKMTEYVSSVIEKSVPSDLHADGIVLGSNCMEDFIRSAMSVAGGIMTSYNGYLVTDIDSIASLYQAILGKPYDMLTAYYPANPRFMGGADKVLINLLALAKAVHATRVFATNESVSTGLARLLLLAPREIRQLGLWADQLSM